MSETILDEIGDDENGVRFGDILPFAHFHGRCCATTRSGKPCRGRRRLHLVGDRLYCVAHVGAADAPEGCIG